MDINMSDVMLHINETLDIDEQHALKEKMRDQTGVVGLGYHDSRPHLMIVEYNRDATTSKDLLHAVHEHGLNAKLVCML